MYNRECLAACPMKRPVSMFLSSTSDILYVLPHRVHTLMSHQSTETQPKWRVREHKNSNTAHVGTDVSRSNTFDQLV